MRKLGKLPFPLWMAGGGFLLSWGFLFFLMTQASLPTTRSNLLAPDFLQADLVYLGGILLASVATIALNLKGKLSQHLGNAADLGCALIIIGMPLITQVDINLEEWAISLVVGKVFTGFGLGLLWTAWGILLSRCEIGQVENAFLGWIPLLALLLFLAVCTKTLDPTGICFGLLFSIMPLVSVIALRRGMNAQDNGSSYVLPERPLDELPENPCGKHSQTEKATTISKPLNASKERSAQAIPLTASTDKITAMREALRNGLGATLANLVASFSLVSLAWGVLLPTAELGFETSMAIFAIGCALAFLAMWVSMRNTRRWALSTMYRWMLPTMVAGVALSQYLAPITLAGACLCLTMIHIGFEVSSKLFAVHLARRIEGTEAIAISLVFACAALGGIVGCCGKAIALLANAEPRLLLLIVLFFFSILVMATVNRETFNDEVLSQETIACTNREAEKAPQENIVPKTTEAALKSRCDKAAAEYKLSARESEVLFLLMQGRSRAYIREALFISKGTVDTHVAHIYSKTGINSKDKLMHLILDKEKP